MNYASPEAMSSLSLDRNVLFSRCKERRRTYKFLEPSQESKHVVNTPPEGMQLVKLQLYSCFETRNKSSCVCLHVSESERESKIRRTYQRKSKQ